MRGKRSPTIELTPTVSRVPAESCREVLSQARREPGSPGARPPHGRPGDPSPDTVAPAAVERALSLALQRAAVGYTGAGSWEERVRAALTALLGLFDEQPDVALLCIVQSDRAGRDALALREQTLAVLARRLDDGRRDARRRPPEHAAQAVLGGAIGAIRARLLDPDHATIGDLQQPLMSLIVLPYRGAAASRRELIRSGPIS